MDHLADHYFCWMGYTVFCIDHFYTIHSSCVGRVGELNIQFSTLRLASNQVPAQAVELTHASHTGTVDGVKVINAKYSIPHPTKIMISEMIHSFLLANFTVTGVAFFSNAQYHQPYTLIII